MTSAKTFLTLWLIALSPLICFAASEEKLKIITLNEQFALIVMFDTSGST